MTALAGMGDLGGAHVIASVSGGKDSAAMALALRDAGIAFTPVFLDTGWEHPDTYAYIRGPLAEAIGDVTETAAVIDLPDHLVPMAERVEALLMGRPSPMVRLCLAKGMFPSRTQRFCTQVLKVFALASWLDDRSPDLVNAVGIRRAESKRREATQVWTTAKTYGDRRVWAPLATWTTAQVMQMHFRGGLQPNPLYLQGSSRVGCWPCIMCNKPDLALLGKDDPRVSAITLLEQIVGDLAEDRARAAGTTLEERGHCRPTWFQSRHDDRQWEACPVCRPASHLDDDECFALGPDLTPACEACQGTGKRRTKGSRGEMWPIANVVEWARSDAPEHEQMGLFGSGEGCMRWGLCE